MSNKEQAKNSARMIISNALKKVSSKWSIRAISMVVVLFAWQIVGLDYPIIVSTPSGVLAGLVDIVLHTTFVSDLGITLWTFFVGYVVAVALGIAVAAIMYRWKVVEVALDPYITALYNAPYIALVPLFMILFGVDFLARTIVVLLSVVFVIIINSLAGFKNAGNILVETSKSFGHSGLSTFRKVVLPGAFPYIMVGMRIGIPRGLVGVLVAETVGQIVYIGYLLQYYSEATLQVGDEFAIIIVLAMIGLGLIELAKYGEAKVSAWRPRAERA